MSGHSALIASQAESSSRRVRRALQKPKEPSDELWAPRWREILRSGRHPPADFAEFDRLVRSMLNRISSENARRLLPLEQTSCGSGLAFGNDYPHWWASRFVALMMDSYLQVIHTNRFARGLAVRSADNILPTYIDAVAPLLKRSPRLVTAMTSWFAGKLGSHEISWSTSRLILLAAHDKRDRNALPANSLARLPADLLQRRILAFLHPPLLHFSCVGLTDADNGARTNSNDHELEEGKKDIVAVLVHLIVFAPCEIWPQLSACAFSLAENALGCLESPQELQVQDYLAASALAAIAQRMEMQLLLSMNAARDPSLQDLGILNRLIFRLRDVMEVRRRSSKFTQFVDCRTQVAFEHARRVQESFQGRLCDPIPMATT